jgi:hypothetical protein
MAAGCGTSAPPKTSPVEYAACLGNAPTPGLGAYDSQFVARVEDAAYIVQATVTQVHASTVPDPGDTTHTVIAHVESVVFVGAEIQQLGATWGDTITIDLTGGDLDVGASVFLLATVEEYNGGALEVAEITRVDTQMFPNVAADIPRIETLLAANPLYARIASSVQIISGVVESVGAASPGSSEHSPAWRLSDLTVDTTLCSGGDGGAMAAGFASSSDTAWFHAPKLTAGQTAVLLLHHAEVAVPFSDETPDLFVVDPLDVHAQSDQASIAALLATPPALP